MCGRYLLWFMSLHTALIGQLTCANILDVTCINFKPVYNSDSSASYAAILNGADVTSTASFQRLVDLNTGVRSSTWCSQGDDVTDCELPQGSTIDSGKVTFRDTDEDKFGVYGCRAERYNWTTVMSTVFISDDAHFSPEHFTMTVSLDEEVRLAMNAAPSPGTGSLMWKLNHESGGQTDQSFNESANALYISKANKENHAGIHHYFYSSNPDRGGLVRLIVRGCLDNLWGPDCQYTCPTCYNGGVCDDVSGRCVCPPGFSGDHCQNACEAGKFGQDCMGSCSSLESGRTNCSGAVFCLPDPYGCSCAAGWTGLTCDQACPAGSYGAGCTQTCHCDSSVSCDSITGACSSGCEDGWIGDQCQVTILDITAVLRQGGVHDGTGDNFLGIFMIGDSSVTSEASLRYYAGRVVDTGPGETGHGATSGTGGSGITTSWTDTGLPQDSTFGFNTNPDHNSLRSFLDQSSGAARVGAYQMSVDYRGWTERNVLLNEYRGDSNSEVWPVKLSTTVGIGETVTLIVSTATSVSTESLRWRHNGGNEILEWNGLSSVNISDIRKSDEGIYECYVNSNREAGKHAVLRLIVRSCPSSKYGFDCSQNCTECYAGGVCHDITGECVCRPGFRGANCETVCDNNHWGKGCTVRCSNGGNCQNRLFSAPDPVGLSCINGFSGDRCQARCGSSPDSSSGFGAGCELDCHCSGTCDAENGCLDQCLDNYEGTYCQALKSDLDCPSGYFGVLCNYPCHCDGDVACERSSGQCPNGVTCADGWAGSDCQQALPGLLVSPVMSDITNDSALLIWNAWIDGYDYGNGPVHSYQIDYTWIDDVGNTGVSGEPVIIFGDSTAEVTGLFGYRDYNFFVSVRREVEGQPVAGVRSGPISAKTGCGAPLLAPEILSTVVNGISNITITWKIPQTPSSSWLQCDSSMYSFSLRYLEDQDPTTVDGSESTVYTLTVDQLDTCTAYEFSVVVVNSISLQGPANQTTAMTDKIPPEPVEDANTTSTSYNHLEIMWLEPDSECGVPSYKVSRRPILIDQCDDSSADVVTWRETDVPSIEYDDLHAFSTYEFELVATLDGYDAEVVFILTHNSTESIPTAEPEDFTVDSTVKGTLSYSWSIPPCGRRNGAISYYYEFREVEGNDERSGNITETSKFFENLKHYVEYNFTLCARTNIGRGPCISNQTLTLPSEPSLPQNVASNEDLTNQTYTVITWEEPQDINGIFVRYDIQKNMEPVIELGEGEKVYTYSFSDLEPDTEYNIKVRAVSSGGEGEWASTPVTTAPIPVPRTPGLPVVTDKGETYISIEWEHIDEAELGIYTITHYIVSVASSQSTGDGDMYDVTNITSPMVYTIEPLESGTEYFIKVRAVNEGGRGDWSESLTEATNQPPGPNAAAIGAGVGISFFLIIVASLGFVVYTRRRRDAPAPPPKEFDLEGVEAEENGGTSSSAVVVPTAVTGTSKAKPTIKPRPPQYQPILISNLAKFVKARRLSPDGFEKEFKDLLNRSDQGCIGNNPENKPKNRYKNVVTYDEHRVKLNKLPTEPGADYINATFMAGYKKEKAFIASQGPNTASLNDFWQMVYEQRTATIVMLTNLVEKEKTKCLKYWPASGEHEEYGELEVIGKEVEDRGSYVLRKFEVGKPGRKFHEVSQYHYTIWPDMGVPESSQPLIDFRDIVKAANPADAGPTIVHCSAGAGRTGTYITIDCMMEMIEAEDKIDVFNFVNNMRKRRAFMVQVQAQYEFIYETLLQWSVCKKVSFNIVDLPVTVKKWRTKHADSSKTEMSRQFEVLESIAPQESMGSDQRGSLPENAKKNRYPDRVPLDKFQPLLMTKGDTGDENEYINASFFDVEGQKNAHVCTQCPLMTTIGDFWRLVWDYDVNTVIHLNEMDSTCGQYWPDHDRVNFSLFTIELLSDKKHTDTMIERVLRVTCSNKKDERQISQFQYLGWPNDSLVPSSKMDFFDLLMQADNNNTSEKRFLVVCMNGVGASPTCLAAIATIDKVKEDKTVDVFSAVKRLRKSRPGVVDELERYEFCFDVLAAYQDSVQTYANYM